MNCNIIEDMIPLCKEGLCNDETKAMVDEHIRECEKCRKLFEDFTAETKNSEVASPDESKVFRKVNKKMKRSKLKIVLLSGILLVIIGVLGFLTYGQITHQYGTMSFESLVQSVESWRVAKLIADGNMDAYADSISYGTYFDTNTHMLGNLKEIREQNRISLNEAYDKYMKGKKVKYVVSLGRYDSNYLTSGLNDNPSGNMIINQAQIAYKDGSSLDMEFIKSYDGKYICLWATNHVAGDEDAWEFGEVISYANRPNFAPKGIPETLFCKYNKDTLEKHHISEFMMRNWFIKEERDNVNEGLLSYYTNGYTFDNVVISDLKYDRDNHKLYYDMVFEARDSKGTAMMKVKVYSTPSGLVPPAKEDIMIYREGCTDGLYRGLQEVFGKHGTV